MFKDLNEDQQRLAKALGYSEEIPENIDVDQCFAQFDKMLDNLVVSDKKRGILRAKFHEFMNTFAVHVAENLLSSGSEGSDATT